MMKKQTDIRCQLFDYVKVFLDTANAAESKYKLFRKPFFKKKETREIIVF